MGVRRWPPVDGWGLAGPRGQQGFLGHCLPPGHQAEGSRGVQRGPCLISTLEEKRTVRALLQRAQARASCTCRLIRHLSLLPSSCRHSIRPQLLAGGPGESQLLQHKPGDAGAEVHHLPSFYQVSPAPLASLPPTPTGPSRMWWAAVPQCPGCFRASPLVEGTGPLP